MSHTTASEQRICVLGLGYIGLPTASLLANKGYKVLGVDVDASVVAKIQAGGIHIQEPDLDVMVRSAIQSGQLRAQMQPEAADIFIIAVPTPFKDGFEPDLTYIESACKAIADVIEPGNLIILESTSPVGTTQKVAEWIQASNPKAKEAFFAHCPERVLPGRILVELIENTRVVGGLDIRATDKVAAFYESFVRGEVCRTDAKTAELSKLVENSFRDVNIAFANELSMLAGQHGVNVWELIRIANKHPRVNILSPGPGVGGHCIAVDPWFLIHGNEEHTPLIRTARSVNKAKEDWLYTRVQQLAGKLRSPTIGCLGLTYKPNVDDLRESPALNLVRRLQSESDRFPKLLVSEPHISSLEQMELVSTETVIDRSDIILGLVNHREYARIDPERLKEKIVIDACGIFT